MAIFRYGQFSIWQNSVSTLAKINAIGQIFIVVNIEQLIKASGHTGAETRDLLFRVTDLIECELSGKIGFSNFQSSLIQED